KAAFSLLFVAIWTFAPGYLEGALAETRSAVAPPSPKAIEAEKKEPPRISSLLKEKILKRVLEDREIQSYASLDTVEGKSSDPPLKRYSFYSVMRVNASLARVREVLTNYKLYS